MMMDLQQIRPIRAFFRNSISWVELLEILPVHRYSADFNSQIFGH